MNNEIFTTDPNQSPPVIEVEPGWIAHVNCEGARWHVLSWSSTGVRCSEGRCIKNKVPGRDKPPMRRDELNIMSGSDSPTYRKQT